MVENLGDISTPWTMIQAVQRPDASPELRRHCLDAICLRYRDPVCEYLRVFGVSDANDRDDLTQTFFTRLLERDWIDKLDPRKGSLRGFLVTSLRNFVANEQSKASNRNPESPLTRLSSTGGDIPESVASSDPGPDIVFNKQWAKMLVEEAIAAFKEDCRTSGLQHYFDVFERHDLHPSRYNNPSYADTAKALGFATTRIVTNHLSRARMKFGEVVRRIVRQTVNNDDQVEEEMAQLEHFLSDMNEIRID